MTSRSYHPLAIAAVLAILVSGCGRSSETVKKTPDPPLGAPFGSKASDVDKSFFSRLVDRELGDGAGRVELRDNGILIHPGETKPTSASFRLGGEVHQLTVSAFISPLDDRGRAVPEAGTVNVEFLLDGRSIFKAYIDRNSSVLKTLDVSGGQQLVVRVDNANGKAWWDWFVLSIRSINQS